LRATRYSRLIFICIDVALLIVLIVFQLAKLKLDLFSFWGGIPNPLVSHTAHCHFIYFLKDLVGVRLQFDGSDRCNHIAYWYRYVFV
jgi:hypothetical protein